MNPAHERVHPWFNSNNTSIIPNINTFYFTIVIYSSIYSSILLTSLTC